MAHDAPHHDAHDHAHDHGHHHSHEPEQNEIAGPVVLALMLLTLVVVTIGFLAA